MTPVEIEVAVLAVLDIICASGSPRDAIEVLLLTHLRLTVACKGQVDVEKMLLRYVDAFRLGYEEMA